MLRYVIRLAISTVHPAKVDLLLAWLAELQFRADEVRGSFQQAGVTHEQAYLLRSTGQPTLVYATEAQNHLWAREAVGRSRLAVDLEHKAVLNYALTGPEPVELLYDVRAPHSLA
jgi:hypothetical protein